MRQVRTFSTPLLWAKALDDGNAGILETLLTDVVVDLTPATDKIELSFPMLTGEGPDVTKTRHALMGNTWTMHVRSTPDGPRVSRFVMDCRWMEGDPSVLLATIA